MKSGQITVFLTLTFLLLLGFLLSIFKAAAIQTGRQTAQKALLISSEAIMSDYHILLEQDYGLLALDAGYGQREINMNYMESILNTYLHRNVRNTGIGTDLSVQSVCVSECIFLTDYDFRLIKQQIADYMKYNKGIDRVVQLLAENSFLEEISDLDEEKKSLTDFVRNEEETVLTLQQEYQNNELLHEEDNTNINDSESVRDPRKNLEQLLKMDILTLVMKEPSSISASQLETEELPYPTGRSKDIDQITSFDETKQLLEVLSEESLLSGLALKIDDLFSGLITDSYYLEVLYSAAEYNKDSNHTGGADKRVISYEVEYLIFGNQNDRNNLKSVVNQILLIRMILNFLYLMNDRSKTEAVKLVSDALSLLIPVPFIGKIIYLLIIAAWAYAEAIVDARQIMSDGKVPLYKKSSDWNLSLDQLTDINIEKLKQQDQDDRQNMKGMSYTDFLRLFLLSTDENVKMRRFLNIVEQNIRLAEPAFRIRNCIYGIETQAEYQIGDYGWSSVSAYSY